MFHGCVTVLMWGFYFILHIEEDGHQHELATCHKVPGMVNCCERWPWSCVASFFLLFLVYLSFLQCHQQPPGNTCGFCVIHHMVKAMELLSMADDPEVYLPSDGSYFPCLRTEIWMYSLKMRWVTWLLLISRNIHFFKNDSCIMLA